MVQMMTVPMPDLGILALPQRRLWAELATPDHFTLYRGTALALRLGHRSSVDYYDDVPASPIGVRDRLSAAVGSVDPIAPPKPTPHVKRPPEDGGAS